MEKLKQHRKFTDLFSTLFDDEEHVGTITDSEGESVFEGVTAVMVVTNAVLIDVIHSEGVGLAVMLTITCALNGPVSRSLNDSERNQVLLTENLRKRDCQTGVKLSEIASKKYKYTDV